MSGWQDRFKGKATSASKYQRWAQAALEKLPPKRKTPEERAADKVERLEKLRRRRNKVTGLTLREAARFMAHFEGDCPELQLRWPGTVKPAGNAHEMPLARHRRVQEERDRAAVVLELLEPWAPRFRGVFASPVVDVVVIVQLTRLAKNELDDDNLAGAFKGVRDEIATWLRADDRDERVRFFTYQDRGDDELDVRLRLETVRIEGVHPYLARRSAELATVAAEWARRRT